MAKDLGSINYTEESKGTRQVDYGAELAGIKGGLALGADATKGIILAGVEDTLEAEMKKGINDIPTAEAPESQRLEDISNEDLVKMSGLTESDKAEIVSLSNQIRAAKNAYAQAPDTGRQNRAVLAIKRAQQKAKAKFGFMSDEIDRAAATLQNTSPALFQAALDDRDSVAKRAEKDDYLKRLRDDARTMDIPENIPLESPQFAHMYLKETKREYARSSAQREYETLAALNKLGVREKMKATVEAITEDWGDIQTTLYGPVTKALSEISVARGAVIEGTGSEADVAAANEKFEALRGQFQGLAISKKSQINRGFFSVWAGEDPESHEYKTAWALAQQQIADIEAIEKLMEQGNLNVADYMKAQSHARGAKLREQMPTMQDIMDIAQVSNFDVWQMVSKLDHTYSSLALEDLVSKGLQEELGDIFGRHVADESVTKGQTTWEGRRARLREKDAMDPNSGGLTESPLGTVEHLQEVWGIYEVETIGGSLATPTSLKVEGVADSILKRTAYTLDRFQIASNAAYARNQNLDLSTEAGKVIDYLGGDKFQQVILNATEAERSVFGGALGTAVLAGGERGSTLGIMPQDTVYESIQADATRNDYGVPFIKLVEADTSRIEEDGVITFKLNEDRARQYVRAVAQQEASFSNPSGFRTDRIADQIVEKEMLKLHQQAAKLSKKATQYLRIRAYQGMQADPVNIDYWAGMRGQRLNTTLLNIFGVDDVSAQ